MLTFETNTTIGTKPLLRSSQVIDMQFAACEHDGVNVISRKALKAFAERHKDASEPLDNWYKRAKKAHWQNLSEVKVDYPHADLVGKCIVFNIGGNKYRLITKFSYIGQAIYIKHVLTHKEYDTGEWKNDC